MGTPAAVPDPRPGSQLRVGLRGPRRGHRHHHGPHAVRAPNANAIAERVIGTLRRECLDYLIVINERHLRRVLGEYIQHYNAMRPHRSLGLDSPEGPPRTVRFPGARLHRHAVLGGLHHEYGWAA